MSDFIYSSSLRAAKSKANYLFEGDFRRRPNQNLSGASQSVARDELLQQAAEERQNREFTRRKELAAIKLQSVWRAHNHRQSLSNKMREKFDKATQFMSKTNDQRIIIEQRVFFVENELSELTREFIVHYNSKLDVDRFNTLIDFIVNSDQNLILKCISEDASISSYKINRLLIMNLELLKNCCESVDSRYLKFLDKFTSVTGLFDENQQAYIWHKLIENKIYTIFRNLVSISNSSIEAETHANHLDQIKNSEFNLILLELVNRSLNISSAINHYKVNPVIAFFKEFLKGPPDYAMSNFFFPELIKRRPKMLEADHILNLLRDKISLENDPTLFNRSNPDDKDHCIESVWFAYNFVKAIYSQIDGLSDANIADYLIILSRLLIPAEFLTNMSMIQAVNDDEMDENGSIEISDNDSDDDDDNFDSSAKAANIGQQNHREINRVISKILNLINSLDHINRLKSMIFDFGNQQVQNGIIQICNLMLSHEHLAVFNCRLLYTIAFNREFTRSLWKDMISLTLAPTVSKTGHKSNIPQPLYLLIGLGNNLDHRSWDKILPRLRLFCSLYSYILPTLDDETFYNAEHNEDDKILFNENSQSDGQSQQKTEVGQQLQTAGTSSANSGSSYFVDKELVGISAVLRDLCIGFIDIIYQCRKRINQLSKAPSRFDPYYNSNERDERDKLLSFEIKLCFKAIVRLVRQLHARDSRKQFCPDDHWICPMVVIPSDKAIDFQILCRQQGRLMRQMTKDSDKRQDQSMKISANDIKIVLILQEIPFVVPFQDRVQILHKLLRREKSIHQSEMANYHFGLPGGSINIEVRRNYIYEDAFKKLTAEKEPNIKLSFRVSMISEIGTPEAGIDGGGLTKEFLNELMKAGFDPMRGFFKETKDHLIYPNPSANVLFKNLIEGFPIHYEFLGRILGKSIFENIMVEIPFANFFLNKLLARRHSSDVDLHNLASLDPILYKNLLYLKNYEGDVTELNLDFTISNNELDEHEVVELKPNGANILVTRENRIEYVHLVADYRLNKRIRTQCSAFKRGISQIIDLDWLRMFDPKELQILISGTPTMIDVNDWRAHTHYGGGYSDDCKVIETFWKVVSSFDETQKRKLLKFATSCSLPPLLGFKDLVPEFLIRASEEGRLPTSSTCINALSLPSCEDENTMKSKLLYAIESNSGFELG